MILNFEAYFSDWKMPSLMYTDEGDDLYPEGMCSTAFLGGDGFTQIQTYSFLSSLPCVYEMAPR